MNALSASRISLRNSCRESSRSNFQNVNRNGSRSETNMQAFQSCLDTHQKEVKAKLDAEYYQSLDKQSAHMYAMPSRHDAQHQQHIFLSPLHQLRLSDIQIPQNRFSSRQDGLIHAPKRTRKRVAVLERKKQKSSQPSTRNCQQTISLLHKGFKKAVNALNNKARGTQQMRNDVCFRGDRPDKMMFYLIPIKDELNLVVDHLRTQKDRGIPIQDILYLREQFQQLLGSAAQEDAARCKKSSATSFDRWRFLGQENATARFEAEQETGGTRSPERTLEMERSVYDGLPMAKRTGREAQVLLFGTNFGKIRLLISTKGMERCYTDIGNDVALSYTARTEPLHTVDIRFTQASVHHTCPRISIQLSIFTKIPDYSAYHQLFKEKSTTEKFDRAIRQGVISPYHLIDQGCNALLFVSVMSK